MLLTTACRHSFRSLRPCVGHTQSRSFLQSSQKWFPRVSRIDLQSEPTVAPKAGQKPTTQAPPQPPPPLSFKSVPSFGEQIRRPGIGKQIVFFLCGSAILFSATHAWTARDNLEWAAHAKRNLPFFPFRQFTVDDLRKLKHRLLVQTFQEYINTLRDSMSTWSETTRNIQLAIHAQFAQLWIDSSEGRRLCWYIFSVNALVWTMWKIPRLSGFMNHAFMHNPLSGQSYTLLTSMFSHKSFMHLSFNSMALASFGGAVGYYLPRTQTGGDVSGDNQLLFFLISAGLFSGLVSHIVSAKFFYPRMLSQINKLASLRASSAASALMNNTVAVAQQTPVRQILPSLGISGAVYGAMTLTALAYPDTTVGILFIPIGIPISLGVWGLVGVDILGAIRGWQLFDHYAHLGGAAFGVLYYTYGKDLWHEQVKVAEHLLEEEMEERRKKRVEERSRKDGSS